MLHYSIIFYAILHICMKCVTIREKSKFYRDKLMVLTLELIKNIGEGLA